MGRLPCAVVVSGLHQAACVAGLEDSQRRNHLCSLCSAASLQAELDKARAEAEAEQRQGGRSLA